MTDKPEDKLGEVRPKLVEGKSAGRARGGC